MKQAPKKSAKPTAKRLVGVYIDLPLLEQSKLLAFRRNHSFSHLVEQALSDLLKKYKMKGSAG